MAFPGVKFHPTYKSYFKPHLYLVPILYPEPNSKTHPSLSPEKRLVDVIDRWTELDRTIRDAPARGILAGG